MIQTHATRLLFSGLVVLLFASFAINEGFSQDVGDEVEQVIKNFLVPFSKGNVSEFIEYFADDATMFFPGSALPSSPWPKMRVQGKNNIAREFETVLKGLGAGAGLPGVIQPQNLLVQRFDDTAIVTFHIPGGGRRTFVLRRIGSQWKIVHLHASP
jgi:ketosteroid isomerase-like protein